MAQDQGAAPTPGPTQTTSPDRTDDRGRGIASALERLRSASAGLVSRLKRLRGPIVAIAAVGAVLSGLVGYWNAYRTVHDGTTPDPVPKSGAPPALSIAILPFNTLGSKVMDESLAE